MGIQHFLHKWSGREGGAERANYAMFLVDLANALDLPCPEPADSRSAYRFEYPVDGDFGQKLRIDLYKENSFILEAKQSRLAVNPYRNHAKSEAAFHEDLFGNPVASPGSARRTRWAADMDAAFRQARDYAQRLAPHVDRPPFLITCDVGRTFEFYADFSGQGRAYKPFVHGPAGRRVIELEHLAEEDVQAFFRKVWIEPRSLDPTLERARVTRTVADHLAGLSRTLEARGHASQEVAFFLSRMLFVLFAKDVGLLPREAEALRLGLGRADRMGLEAHIRPYLNGRDVTGRSRDALVIDLFGLTETQVRDRFPEVYQHLALKVRPERQQQFDRSPTKDAAEYLEKWWVFGKPRKELRSAISGGGRFIATVETAKHRIFQFFDSNILPDNMLVSIASDDAAHLAVLSSSAHTTWALRAGGWLGVGNDPRYSKSRCFDPFAFPSWSEDQYRELSRLGEGVNAFRRARLAEFPGLTLTRMYNALQAYRAGCVPEKGLPNSMTPEQARDFCDASVVVLAELHTSIDRLTLEAYGWGDLALLAGGEQEQALLTRLVALNAERRIEEAKGQVRWLRPEYQASRSRMKLSGIDDRQTDVEELLSPTERVAWPREPRPQLLLLKGALSEAEEPLSVEALVARFKGRKAAQEVPRLLATLEHLGQVRVTGSGYTLLRAA